MIQRAGSELDDSLTGLSVETRYLPVIASAVVLQTLEHGAWMPPAGESEH